MQGHRRSISLCVPPLPQIPGFYEKGEESLSKIKKAAALLLCLLFLAGAGHTVTAAEAGGKAAASDIPNVTFTNKENTTPDLNVVKYVQNLDSAYPAPTDAEFTFVVKIDGELYKNQEYELYPADAPGKTPETRRTDRNGSFRLKAGDRARFVYVGSGRRYEVYEENLPENFVQIIPAQGTPLTGIIPLSGVRAAFTNEYQPATDPEPGPDSKPETTKLLVSKRIAFPGGYTPPQSPKFRFQVTIDGKPYGDEPYEIVSLTTGLPLGSGVTAGLSTPEADGQPGEFTLNAGEQAVFSQIPINVDYKVEEILEGETEGWWSTNGVTSQEGATKAPAVTANFINANTSFIVTKQLEDNSKPEKDFTFTLMKGDRSHWAGAAYYLYSTKGNRLDDITYETDGNGRFSLQPGQAAVFFGIAPGTLYHVAEEKDPEYSQLTPNDSAGYQDQVVKKNVEVLPFINRREELKGVLTVTKKVNAEDGVSPEAPQEFTFCLRKKTDGTGGEGSGTEAGFAPMQEIPYQVSVGTTTRNGRTDREGNFTLKAGETARFESLLKGTYQVEEITEGLSPEYTIPEPDKKITGDLNPRDEAGLTVTFTNTFKVLPLSIEIKKTGWRESTLLPGAVFCLYRDKGLTEEVEPESWETEHPGQPFDGYVTDDKGTVRIPDLKVGTYYLKEIKAPEGYRLLANPLEIVITRKGDKLEATVNSIKPTQGSNGQVSIDGQTVTIHIQNSKGFSLPATGGMGILLFLAVGAVGIVVVSVLLTRKSRDTK